LGINFATHLPNGMICEQPSCTTNNLFDIFNDILFDSIFVLLTKLKVVPLVIHF